MDILNGFISLLGNPAALATVFGAAVIGVIVGATPGLTTAAAIAMLVPVTYYLDPIVALVGLYVIGKAGRFGGSISAVLFNTPGTAGAAATQLDGYPMTRNGQPGKALKVSVLASGCGDFLGDMVLIFGATFIASYTMKLGPPEYLAIYVMAFIVIGSVVGNSIAKGLVSSLFGILIATVGLDPVSGATRFDFGDVNLMSGFSLVPLLVGTFVISEVLIQAQRSAANGGKGYEMTTGKAGVSQSLSADEVKRCAPVVARSSITGAIIGMLPGLGSSVAAFVAYGEERRRSKHPEKWGTGIAEGVAAPESANNAVSGPSMIPLLTLGVPGSTIAAMLMGVMMIHGIQVGPSIFTISKDLIFTLFAAGLLGIVSYVLIGYYGSTYIGRTIAKIPPRLIYPTVFILAFLASYSVRSSLFDVFVMLVFGGIGYVMRRYDYSVAAFVIAFILARGAEEALRQSLLISEGSLMIFIERPVAAIFLAIGFIGLALRIRQAMRQRKAHEKKKELSQAEVASTT